MPLRKSIDQNFGIGTLYLIPYSSLRNPSNITKDYLTFFESFCHESRQYNVI